jgi:hypothetical protein
MLLLTVHQLVNIIVVILVSTVIAAGIASRATGRTSASLVTVTWTANRHQQSAVDEFLADCAGFAPILRVLEYFA